ncbi:hypothetical protein [Deinococcus hopiensis]|nr:hypothetical protein [Deinococcus hopiensis]
MNVWTHRDWRQGLAREPGTFCLRAAQERGRFARLGSAEFGRSPL